MKTYYRIEETKNIENMMSLDYTSAHHVGRAAVDDMSIFYLPEMLDKTSLPACEAGCGCLRLSKKIADAIRLPLDDLPVEGFEYDDFCITLDGVCALETKEEIYDYFHRNYQFSEDLHDRFKIVEFIGEKTGSVYDGVIVKPIEILNILPI